MRTDFTTGFSAARNKKANAPVNLMQIDWPAMNGLPALTLRLTDRSGIQIDEVDWYPLIQDMGNIDRLISADLLASNSGSSLSVSVVNVPVDLLGSGKRFSHLFRHRPPESAMVKVFQWFAGEGLDGSDLAEIFVARIGDPVAYDESTCSFDLIDISESYGARIFGNAIHLEDYPDAPENSIGKTKPIVIGTVENAPGILVRKSQQTILTTVAIPGGTILTVASTEKFPPSGFLIVNDDEVEYTSKNSTQFLGCSGINEFHYADDSILEKVSDHRYLFSDPAYPIKQISNVKVDGHLADSGEYATDINLGEVIFSSKPKKSDSIDTKFLQAQNDQVGSGNTAVNPTNATIPNSPTNYAKINQSNNLLSLKQTDNLPNIGEIGKVFLRVEHFVEEKLPNDNLTAHVSGVGQVGTLSAPAVDDVVVASGTTDITHTHLDTLGFPISDPQHHHTESLPPKITQNALSGVGGQVISLSSGQTHLITFPDAGPGTWATGEYGIAFEWTGTASGGSYKAVSATSQCNFNFGYLLWSISGTTQNYSTGGNINNDCNTIVISHNTTFISFYIRSATRVVTMAAPNPVSTQSTNISTSKSGDITLHASNPAVNSTAEKATRSVVDLFDITTHVNGDWNWFQDRESQVQYNGSSDGRTAFIVHLAYEVEYARRRIEFTDVVSAEISGVKDDSLGSITSATDSLIERPDHIYKWSILNVLGLDSTVIDNTSINQAGTLFSSSGYLLAGIVNEKTSFLDLWQQWGKECRAYFYWDLGKAKILFRTLNLSTTTTVVAKVILDNMVLLDSRGEVDFKVKRNPINNVVNKLDLRYNRKWDGDGYQAVKNLSDLESQNMFGVKEKPGEFDFNWIRQQAMVLDIGNFYLQELKEPRDVYEIGLLLDNMEIEKGDILEINPPAHELDKVRALVLGSGKVVGSGIEQRMDTVKILARQMGGVIGNEGFGLQAFGISGFAGVERN
ncbi:MAG: hypothetical protein H8E32_11035 [Nitrospinae bacterium]|nr:hypothetical protein [Nitrospinota bacterium]